MWFRSLSYALAINSFFFCADIGPGSAQDAGGTLKTASSNGLTVSIAKVIVNRDTININMLAKNTTKTRVYLIDAQSDNSQTAFLGSGAHLTYPNAVAGMPRCDSVMSCLGRRDLKDDLNNYTYIEPGEIMPFSFKYYGAAQPNDNISFNIALIARFATQENGNPDITGPQKSVHLSFPYVPLKQ